MKDATFRENFERSVIHFQKEIKIISPLLTINNNISNEIKKHSTNFIEHACLLTRMNYLIQSKTIFDIDEYLLCLKTFSMESISSTLKLFAKPNHKERFSSMISFFESNPETLANIFYFCLNHRKQQGFANITDDDLQFFCTCTIPSIFRYFITESLQSHGLTFCETLFHLFNDLNSVKSFSPSFKDITFSFFLSTNPGLFFNKSVLQNLSTSTSFIQDRYLYYNKTLCRKPYWLQVIQFVKQIIENMCENISLLPLPSRRLIRFLYDMTSSQKRTQYELIIDNIICRYLTTLIDFPNQSFLQDAAKILKLSSGINVLIDDEITITLVKSPIEVDTLIHKLIINRPMNQEIADGMNLVDTFTVETPRDLGLLYKIVKEYHNMSEVKDEQIAHILSGLVEPLTMSDQTFLCFRSYAREDPMSIQIKLTYTQQYNELINLLNIIDLTHIHYNSADDLIKILDTYSPYPIPIIVRQMLRPELVNNLDDIIVRLREDSRKTHMISKILASSLFILQNEHDKLTTQLNFLCSILMKRFILPYLHEHDYYPFDFLYEIKNMFSALSSYDQLISKASQRIRQLQISAENEKKLKKIIIMDFIDQIDLSCEFQLKVQKDDALQVLSKYLINNYSVENGLSSHFSKMMNNSALLLQFVKSSNRISANLYIVLTVMRSLSAFSEEQLMLTIAISSNPEIFGFIYFIRSYFRKEEMKKVVLNPEEMILLTKFTQAAQKLRSYT